MCSSSTTTTSTTTTTTTTTTEAVCKMDGELCSDPADVCCTEGYTCIENFRGVAVCSVVHEAFKITQDPSVGEKLQWLEGNSSLDIEIYQDGTGVDVGNCGLMQATNEGFLDISSNDCRVELKPLCLRHTNIILSETRKRKKHISRKKQNSLKRWKKRMSVKLRKNRKGAANKSNSICLLWKDLVLPGNVNLGQICTKMDHRLSFEKADKFCKVSGGFFLDGMLTIHLQEELDASLFNLNELFPTEEFASQFLNFEVIKK